MQLPTNIIEIELFGKKLLLSERTARDVNALMDYSKKHKGDPFSGIMNSAVVIRDGLKINFIGLEEKLNQLNNKPAKWYEFKKKKEIKSLSTQVTKLKEITSVDKIINLPIRLIDELSTKVLELEGVDVEALKKKVMTMTLPEREGLAVTLQED
jgi:hypothetical protein